MDEEMKKEHIGFDLELENILSSGLSQVQKEFAIEDVKNILSSDREIEKPHRKKSDANKIIEKNIEFLEQNKLFVEDLFGKIESEITGSKLSL